MLLNYGAEEDFWNPLNYLDIKPVNLKGNQPWIFVGRTDAEDEALILWLPDTKSRLIGKDPDAGQDWGQEEEGMTEDEMDGITNSMDMSLSQVLEIVKDRGAWCAAVLRVANNRTWLSNWTTTSMGQKRLVYAQYEYMHNMSVCRSKNSDKYV